MQNKKLNKTGSNAKLVKSPEVKAEVKETVQDIAKKAKDVVTKTADTAEKTVKEVAAKTADVAEKTQTAAAKDFYKFVLSDKAKKVFDAYYFDTDVER